MGLGEESKFEDVYAYVFEHHEFLYDSLKSFMVEKCQINVLIDVVVVFKLVC